MDAEDLLRIIIVLAMILIFPISFCLLSNAFKAPDVKVEEIIVNQRKKVNYYYQMYEIEKAKLLELNSKLIIEENEYDNQTN